MVLIALINFGPNVCSTYDEKDWWNERKKKKNNVPSLNKSLGVTVAGRKINERGVSFDSIRRINAGQKRSCVYRLLMTHGDLPM